MNINILKFLRRPKFLGDSDIKPLHHVLFWSIYFLINTFRWSSIHNDFLLSLRTNLIGFPIHMFLAYLNAYYLMPKFIYTKKYFQYTIYILLALFGMLLLKFNLTYYLVSTDVMPEGPEEINSLTIGYAVQTMIGEVYVISFFTAIKLTIDWLRESSKLHDLEKRQLKTELRFLRSQVSPHFFFNTLNNIYSLTLEKSDQAPEVILKLSELMRYLLYATKKQRQDLTSEINCIRNYIDLERIRFDDSLRIDMNISGDLDNCKIAPMLLIPLVENCFKHGASKNIGEMKIVIEVLVTNGFMNFRVSNTIPNANKEFKYPVNSGGIGLSNVKKRLELGYAKNDYELSIYEENKMFNVILNLKVV
ncbi:sensor histidine kinase [Maribacter hydrothermalis]|uniref:Histidine kinase n=1 Tax=Maribacter hydrothermalis TaxID=1836467 RepID=A0A1B7ZF52_9FLAO|nr:histidine kinase [Maribacter hydrothermalis]APQ17724.1 sensor histidine kinase [Maribacter hydrothermalis]OBR42199.1 histidine kinase [Maribacter hydrothermalis]